MSRRWRCAAWSSLTLVAGLAIRMAPLGLPWSVTKYGGSALWAAMIYGVVAAALPNWRPGRVAALSTLLALAIEFGKLYRTPALDAFRLTLAGKLLLGRFFSPRDILAYLTAIALTMAFDTLLWRKNSPVAQGFTES
jgi:hypothetical protein